MLLNVILAVIVIILVAVAGLYLVLEMLGKENVVVDVKKRTPFEVVKKTEDSLTISTTLAFSLTIVYIGGIASMMPASSLRNVRFL